MSRCPCGAVYVFSGVDPVDVSVGRVRAVKIARYLSVLGSVPVMTRLAADVTYTVGVVCAWRGGACV